MSTSGNDTMSRAEFLAQPALIAPPGAEVNFEDPPNMNALANGVFITGTILTSLAVLVRVHSWIFTSTRLKARLEAVLIFIGLVGYLTCAYSLFYIANAELGWFVHQWNVTRGQMIGFSYWIYVAGLSYNVGIVPAKAAILVEWMRIFSPQNHNAFWWVCQAIIWLNVAYYLAATIVEAIQCTPVAASWDPTIKGTCLNTRATNIASSSINVVSDVVIFTAPQFVIWRLQLSKAKKVGIALLFAVGLFGSISAIFRLVATLGYLNSKDSTYTVSTFSLWAFSEITTVFLIYGMPAVPAFYASVYRHFNQCTRGKRTSRRMGDLNPNKPRSKYRKIDRDGTPLDSLDTKTFAPWLSARINTDESATRDGGASRAVAV
ncbi:hypothetical protein F4777DRAFT_226549 [Nemania sp. FL0916]|nr:hypothetical protein F4777DRAFT_226549 [Nemania sp. FL0916]